ncbi:hypothetical protein JTB14_017101 [Gonioctena quinquepunctata]|nr:hypothetical protein JTB14_017101 [Gonioctena quinquepunctata]
MPTPEERLRVQTEFYDRASFLRVIGVVDGTHKNPVTRIRRKFEQGSFPNCVLLGESGKPLTPQLVSEHSPEIKN